VEGGGMLSNLTGGSQQGRGSNSGISIGYMLGI
jgi:hypothetical protein